MFECPNGLARDVLMGHTKPQATSMQSRFGLERVRMYRSSPNTLICRVRKAETDNFTLLRIFSTASSCPPLMTVSSSAHCIARLNMCFAVGDTGDEDDLPPDPPQSSTLIKLGLPRGLSPCPPYLGGRYPRRGMGTSWCISYVNGVGNLVVPRVQRHGAWGMVTGAGTSSSKEDTITITPPILPK